MVVEQLIQILHLLHKLTDQQMNTSNTCKLRLQGQVVNCTALREVVISFTTKVWTVGGWQYSQGNFPAWTLGSEIQGPFPIFLSSLTTVTWIHTSKINNCFNVFSSFCRRSFLSCRFISNILLQYSNCHSYFFFVVIYCRNVRLRSVLSAAYADTHTSMAELSQSNMLWLVWLT